MLSTLNSVITGALAMGNFGLEKAIYFQLILLGVFVVATLVGYKLISNVPTLLHTPLMSGMNALSGVTVLGALSASASLFKLGTAGIVLSAIFGSLAIALAMVNVVGGFMVTDRMLGMIAKKKAKGQTVIYAASAVAGAGLLAVICCMDVIAKGAGTSARDWVYLAMAIVLSLGVLLGIAMMGKVAYSKIGNRFSAICMLLAIILIIVYGNGTSHIAAVWTLYIGLALGAVAGIVLAKKVKMIQMPQMVALLNGLGGAASAIVGAFAMLGVGTGFDAFSTTTSVLAFAVGMITLIGSLVAAGKLHKILPQKPVVYKGHQAMTVGSLCLTLALIVVFAAIAALSGSGKIALGIDLKAFCGIMIALLFVISGFFGYIFAIRVGGADMPITISLLNSLSGVAGAIAGLAINDLLLVAVGGIVGASGLLLTQIMCKAMNRKLGAILLGGTSSNDNAQKTAPEKVEVKAETKPSEVKKEVKAEEKPVVKTEINYAATLNNAKEVIIVPGYGMAIAQAQHLVKQLADKLTANGTKVKYAIHPVAGRMPGHMNVLLCEANVEYEDLFEMDDINPEFKTADATIVIGANDVLNPAANTAEGTPIYGMPVLDVADCKNIFIFNYDLKPGYAGVDNPIYTRENGVHLYLGNAQETLQKFIADMDKPVETTTEVKTEKTEAKPVEVKTETNYAASLNGAKEVIIVPGYGMAIAQAQHLVKQLADKLAAGGTKVKYAIHPVAGRMPGHMNVLLCEADVDYEDLYEMDDILADLAVGVQVDQRRLGEQLQIGQVGQILLVDDRGALGLDADTDARAGVLGGHMGDEGNVGGVVHLDDAPLQALLLDTGDDLAEHLVMGQVDNGLNLLGAEGGRQADDHLVGGGALPGLAILGDGQLARGHGDRRRSGGGGAAHLAHLLQDLFNYTAQRIFIKRHDCFTPLRYLPDGWRLEYSSVGSSAPR